MFSLRLLSLLAIALPVTLVARADTITTNHVVFTYETTAGPQQSNFDLVDGTVSRVTGAPQQVLYVNVYPSTDTLGDPVGGFFYYDFSNSALVVGLLTNGSPASTGIYGNSADPVASFKNVISGSFPGMALFSGLIPTP